MCLAPSLLGSNVLLEELFGTAILIGALTLWLASRTNQHGRIAAGSTQARLILNGHWTPVQSSLPRIVPELF
jgi:hypothetical protein